MEALASTSASVVFGSHSFTSPTNGDRTVFFASRISALISLD